MPTTPYMNLDLPIVSGTLGPEYAADNNAAFTTVDSHNHTSGQGVLIPSAGIGIDADLTFGSYNATALRSARFTAQASPLALVTDRNCGYFSGVDFWVNDGNGNQIQLTASGALNAASIGGIGGDYATSTASVAYSDSTKTFTFLQDTAKSSLLDTGTILLRRTDITSSAAITIQANGSLTVGWTFTLPTAPPAATQVLLMSSSGALSASPVTSTELSNLVGFQMRLSRPSFKCNSADTSQLIIPASAGKPAIVRIASTFYTNTSDLTLDLDTAGANGLDTGTKAANTAYYVYAILPSSGTTFRGVISAAGPATGPTGFSTNWTYLGSFRTIAASAIPDFTYCNGMFCTQNATTEFSVSSSTASAKTFVGSLIASSVNLRTLWTTVNSSSDDLFIGPTSTTQYTVSNASTSAALTQATFVDIPVLTANTVYAKTTSNSDDVNVCVWGWKENPLDYQ